MSEFLLDGDNDPGEAKDLTLLDSDRFDKLFLDLYAPNDVLRACTAAVVEQVVRKQPGLLVVHIEELVDTVCCDSLPDVRAHAAMMLGHLAAYEHVMPLVIPALLGMLGDTSEPVQCQALASLTTIGGNYPNWRSQIVSSIAPLSFHTSMGVRACAERAGRLLSDSRRVASSDRNASGDSGAV